MDRFQYVVVVAVAVSFFLNLGHGGVGSHIIDYWGLPLLNESPAKGFIELNMSCDYYSMGLGVVY